MKGTILLSEGRSGSSWLSRLTSAAGNLGNGKEWFNRRPVGFETTPATSDDYIERVIDASAGPNGYFFIKIFPAHQHRFFVKYGKDPVRAIARDHDVNFMLLERRDVIAQAISFALAYQSKEWESGKKTGTEPIYDFGQIAHFYFRIHASIAHWRAYCALYDYRLTSFVYEDLLPDGAAFLSEVARHAGVAPPAPVEKPSKGIQRNTRNDEWRERFVADLHENELLSSLPSHTRVHSMRRFINSIRR